MVRGFIWAVLLGYDFVPILFSQLNKYLRFYLHVNNQTSGQHDVKNPQGCKNKI